MNVDVSAISMDDFLILEDYDSAQEVIPAVRLEVNLHPDIADLVKHWCLTEGITVTEATRRAFATWNFVLKENSAGNRLIVEERDDLSEAPWYREVVIHRGSAL